VAAGYRGRPVGGSTDALEIKDRRFATYILANAAKRDLAAMGEEFTNVAIISPTWNQLFFTPCELLVLQCQNDCCGTLSLRSVMSALRHRASNFLSDRPDTCAGFSVILHPHRSRPGALKTSTLCLSSRAASHQMQKAERRNHGHAINRRRGLRYECTPGGD
jgi:hypothetical protein